MFFKTLSLINDLSKLTSNPFGFKTHLRRHVVGISDHSGAFEMLVQVVHKFTHPVSKNSVLEVVQ